MKALFDNEYARISFAHHAALAVDEFEEHINDFNVLIGKSNVNTRRFDKLSTYLKIYKAKSKQSIRFTALFRENIRIQMPIESGMS